MSDRSAVRALIGAGPVGLGMAKALLEHKIPYEQLEADRELGGNWLHGVYETVHIVSKRLFREQVCGAGIYGGAAARIGWHVRVSCCIRAGFARLLRGERGLARTRRRV